MKKRVFLIAVETVIRGYLCKKLKMQGHDAGWAANQQDALKNADFLRADLLLIDLDALPAARLGMLSRMAELNPVLEVVGLTERTDQPPVAFGSRLSSIMETPVDLQGVYRVMEELLLQTPKHCGGFRLVTRKAVTLPENSPHRVVEPNICPAAYSGWGINE